MINDIKGRHRLIVPYKFDSKGAIRLELATNDSVDIFLVGKSQIKHTKEIIKAYNSGLFMMLNQFSVNTYFDLPKKWKKEGWFLVIANPHEWPISINHNVYEI